MKITVNKSKFDVRIKILKDFISSTQFKPIFQYLADFTKDMIYKRVKSGYGVSKDTSDQLTKKSFISMKVFSPKYLKYRILNPPTGEFATPKKQNLTYSGQMLKSFITKVKVNGFIIDIADTPRDDSKLNNKQVANYVSEIRPFLAVTDKEQVQIQKEYLTIIRNLARKLFI